MDSIDLPAGYNVVPWDGHVILQRLPGGGGKWYVSHDCTHEKVDLPAIPDDAEWDLVEDEGGSTYLSCGGDLDDATLIADVLQYVPLEDASHDPAAMIVHDQLTGEQQPLSEWHGAYMVKPRALRLTTYGGLAKTVITQVAAFPHGSKGANVWWEFVPLWGEVGAGSDKSSAVVWWDKLGSMSKLAASLGLPEPHVWCCMETGKAIGKHGGRILPFHGLSTHALIGTVARWASDSPNTGGLRAPAGRAVAKLLLSSIIDIGFPEGSIYPAEVFLDSTCSWQPPASPEGNYGLPVTLESGRWDQYKVLHSLPVPDSVKELPDLLKCVKALSDVESKEWSLADFLISVLQTLSLRGWLGKQLVWALGAKADAVVCEWALASSQADGPGPGQPSWATAGLGKGGSWREWRQKERNLLKYRQAAKKKFGTPLNLSTCLDGARVSGRKTICAAVAEPGGYAVVAPPQAKAGTEQTPTPMRSSCRPSEMCFGSLELVTLCASLFWYIGFPTTWAFY